MSRTKAPADSAKLELFVCSLTHFTAGLEQIDKYDRGPEIVVSTCGSSLPCQHFPWYSQLVYEHMAR
jgi:hypothetical protein